MNTVQRSALLRLASLLAVLVFVFGLTTPAYAEGELPQPAPEGDAPAGSTEAPESLPPADPTAPEAPAEEGGEPPADLGETIQTLDENNAVLVDGSGQPVPLASEEAVVLLTAPDPWFTCPLAKDTDDGDVDGKCSYFTIQDAVNNFTAKSGSGLIHIDPGTYTEFVEINAVSGLTGLEGSGSIQKVAPSSQTALEPGYIHVSNMPNGFLVRGFTIYSTSPEAKIEFNNVGGTIKIEDVVISDAGGYGIYIHDSSAAVVLTEVNTFNNADVGIKIDNTRGTGNVTINNSSSNRNGSSGLEVDTRGSATLNGFSARTNYGYGAQVKAQKGVTIQYSVFDQNNLDGVNLPVGVNGNVTVKFSYAQTNFNAGFALRTGSGNIVLESVTANDNGISHQIAEDLSMSGIYISNTGSGTVSVKTIRADGNDYGAGSPVDQRGSGLEIHSKGSVTAVDVIANRSGGRGILINNKEAASAAPVTVKAVNGSFNQFHGIEILSKGTILVDGSSAYENFAGGLLLDNHEGSAGVTIQGTSEGNWITYNEGYWDIGMPEDDLTYPGVTILSKGPVVISSLKSQHNDYGGAFIKTLSAVTIKGSSYASSDFSNNLKSGLIIETPGTISLTFIRAWNNQEYGVLLENPTSRSPVTISRSDISANQGEYGLKVLTQGLITLKGIDVAINQFGALLDNRGSAGKGVVIADKNWSHFVGNPKGGLSILSSGPVTLQNVRISGNTTSGLWMGSGFHVANGLLANDRHYYYFDANDGDSITARLTGNFWGILSVYDNSDHLIAQTSLTADTREAVLSIGINSGSYSLRVESDPTGGAYQLLFSRNGADPGELQVLGGPGLYIDNTSALTPQPVKISNPLSGSYYDYEGEFSGNGGNGVEIYSKGLVTLTAVRANSNYGSGIIVDTSSTSAMTMKQLITTGNWDDGLNIQTNGAVTVQQSEMGHNGGYGVHIATTGKVSITASSSKNNVYMYYNANGIWIESPGAITLSYLGLYDTYGPYGIRLDNPDSLSNVTLTYVRGGGGTDTGILIRTRGTVLLTNCYWNGGSQGVSIDNRSLLKRPVTVNGLTLYWISNTGLEVLSSGTITVKAVKGTVQGEGMRLDNRSGSAGVSLATGSLHGWGSSSGNGLTILTNGPIAVSGFSLSGFDGRGAELNNHDSTLLTPPSVVVSSSAFDDNTSNGLWVSTRGAITLTSVSASWNLDAGMYLRNQDGTANLTIQGASKASSNNSYGVDLLSSGAVLISGLTAESNTIGLYVEDHSNALTINGSYFMVNASYGAEIHMSGEGKPLTITRSHFYQNGSTGLLVDTRGPIVLNTVSANYNPSHGMQITNTNAAGNYPVTILQSYGLNHWDDNGGRGLFVTTRGNFSLTGFTASRNALAGIYFNGCVSEGSGCTGGGTVTINNGTTNENWDDGIFLFSNGPVSVKGIVAFYNGYDDSGTRTPYEGNGITVHSHTFPVLIANSNINANYLHGIHAYLWGTGILTLSNVNYFGNNTSGASGVFDLKIE